MSAYRDVVLGTVPLWYARFGEAAGVVAVDEMGLANGTYVAAPTLGVAGSLTGDSNTAVTFNGTTQWMTTTALPGLTQFSLAARVKAGASGATNDGMIISAQGALVYLRRLPGGGLRFRYQSAGGNFSFDAPGPLPIGTWTDVAAVADAAGGRVYVNGALNASMANVPSAIGSVAWWVAAYNGGLPLDATVDEPAIWNRGLTAAEAAYLRTVAVTGVDTTIRSAFSGTSSAAALNPR